MKEVQVLRTKLQSVFAVSSGADNIITVSKDEAKACLVQLDIAFRKLGEEQSKYSEEITQLKEKLSECIIIVISIQYVL